MNRWEYVALALELWTIVGVLGLSISLARREQRKLLQGVLSLAGVWAVYLAALLTVSHRQPERSIHFGQPVCFQDLCYSVNRTEELSGFPPRNHTRLLRVTVRVVNRGTSPASEDVAPALRDGTGKLWFATEGVSGNALSVRVLAGGSVLGEPLFQLAPDTTGLVMILAHPRHTRHQFVIGDPESLGHRPQVLQLYPTPDPRSRPQAARSAASASE